MNENEIFAAQQQVNREPGKKPMHAASLVLGILSIVFGLLFALIGDILAIIGICVAAAKKKTYNVKAGMICSIIGLIVAIANHALYFVLMA